MTTLRMAYERYHRSSVHTIGTHTEFVTFLRWWEHLTGDLPVEQVDRWALIRFRDAALSLYRLRTRHPYSRNTVDKWLRSASAILHTAEQAELIARVPPKPPLKCPKRALVYASPVDVARIYAQRYSAQWPKEEHTGVPCPLWWGTLVVFLFNVGSRKGEWWRSLPVSAVDLPERLIRLTDHKDGGDAEIKAINPTLAEHLERFIAACPQRVLLFPSPNNPKYLYREWRRIQAAAGIKVARPAWSEQTPFYGFHELRKTCGTMLCAINPRAAQATLGHKNISTTLAHYAGVEETVRRATDALVQPAAFLEDDRPPLNVVG